MKKSLTCFSLLFICALASCSGGGTTEKSYSSLPPINSYNVFIANNNLDYLSVFDESRVSIDVFPTSGEPFTIEHNDISFDYSEYDSTDPSGKTKVKVKAKADASLSGTIELNIRPKDDVKILFIGNSFSDDCINHMDSIANNLGLNMTIANLNLGGSSINDHIYSFQNNLARYTYQKFIDHSLVNTPDKALDYGIRDEDWDYISFQQTSPLTGIADSHKDLNTLISLVKNRTINPEHTKFLWHQTWAFQHDSTREGFEEYYHKDQAYMYSCIMNVCKNTLEPNPNLLSIIPNGTAIQNARTSFVGDTLTRDGFHLSYGLGRYTIGLCTVNF